MNVQLISYDYRITIMKDENAKSNIITKADFDDIMVKMTNIVDHELNRNNGYENDSSSMCILICINLTVNPKYSSAVDWTPFLTLCRLNNFIVPYIFDDSHRVIIFRGNLLDASYSMHQKLKSVITTNVEIYEKFSYNKDGSIHSFDNVPIPITVAAHYFCGRFTYEFSTPALMDDGNYPILGVVTKHIQNKNAEDALEVLNLFTSLLYGIIGKNEFNIINRIAYMLEIHLVGYGGNYIHWVHDTMNNGIEYEYHFEWMTMNDNYVGSRDNYEANVIMEFNIKFHLPSKKSNDNPIEVEYAH